MATSIQLRTNQLNYGFTNKRKKRTYPNKTITQIIICLIGIILRDVLLREYPHFAVTINFKCNRTILYLLYYFSCELLPRPNLCYFYTYEISVSSLKFPFNLVCPLFLINLQMKQFKVHLWTNREGKHQPRWDTQTFLLYFVSKGIPASRPIVTSRMFTTILSNTNCGITKHCQTWLKSLLWFGRW